MILRFCSIAVLLVGWCAAWTKPGEQASAISSTSQPIPASFFGLHIHHAATTTAWPEVPFATWRLWDAYVAWPNLEPHRGQWRFEMLDRYVNLAEQHNVTLLLPLGLSPTWASARPTEKSVYQPGNAAEPRDIEDWRQYVKTVATRYKGRIHEYEIWNEPNSKMFWSGDVPKMVELTRITFEIIREIDPQATVVSPSATKIEGISWLSDFLHQGGGRYVNVIGFHFYVMPQPPEVALPLIQKVRQVMQENSGDDKPLWNTEVAWAYPKPFPSQELGAAYLVRTFVLNWAGGVQRLYWYSWDNHNWVSIETTEKDSQTPNSIGRAYETAVKWLLGARLTGCDEDRNHTWVCKLEKGDSLEWIVWNADHTQKFSMPVEWRTRFLVSLQGDTNELSRQDLEVGQIPVLLSSKEWKAGLKNSR